MGAGMMSDEFDFAADLLRARTGFVLTRDKSYLLENRLGPLVRRHRLKSVSELIIAIRDGREDLCGEMLDAMMTKDTGFFRDWKPFLHLRDLTLRDLAHTGNKERPRRILCAGSSTGQEAYSTALTVSECGWLQGGRAVEIIGIDLSASALATAERAAYTQFEVQRGLPIHTLAHHFTKQEDVWVLAEAVRHMVTLRAWNLLDDLTPLGVFDVILCRNVLAYFDLQSKVTVLHKLADIMTDNARLYLGATETLTGITDKFRAIDAGLSVYALEKSGA
jgi:chemotaxis protein methyltransferase CheR